MPAFANAGCDCDSFVRSVKVIVKREGKRLSVVVSWDKKLKCYILIFVFNFNQEIIYIIYVT